MEDTYDVQKILSKRYNTFQDSWEYLIKWEGYPSSENTWEPEINLIDIPHMIQQFEQGSSKKQKTLKKPRVEDPRQKHREKKKPKTSKKLAIEPIGGPRPSHELDKLMQKRKRPEKRKHKELNLDSSVYDQFDKEAPARSFFSGISFGKPDLRLDRPVRIVGCMPKGETILYAVLFMARLDGSVPAIGWFSHQVLLQRSSHILSEYLMDNIKIDNK